MQYFNFEYLIRKYSTTFTVKVPSKGEYNDRGKFVVGNPTEYSFTGAIISHRQSKVFRSEGRLTQQDRALYMLEPLPDDLQGAFIVYEGNKYTIDSKLENAAFTGVYAYHLKFISAFKEGAE